MAIPVPEKRIAEFEKLGFGMFIHWGLYSQLGRGEWIMNIGKIAKEDYTPLAKTFTASKFDARKIARIAKNAGMKYITLTTRHHEGFSLYDTKGLCDYDVMHTPCGRDLIAEYVEACRDEGIVPFFYHTTLDWYQERFQNDFKGYLQYLRDSVEILCTNYGKIGGLWFDGNWSRPNDDWEEDALYSVIRKHQPDAMIINNTGLSARGEAGNIQLDSVTYEQGRPTPMNRDGMNKYYAAEMCQTMNDHWGIGKLDFNYKSLPALIENLCTCRKVGANYLLNVGPTGEGEIVLMQQALLDGIGGWIRATDRGGAFYTGKPCALSGHGKNFALAANGKYYLYIHDLTVSGDANVTVEEGGAGVKSFDGKIGDIASIEWTDNGEKLEFTQDGEALRVSATGYPYGSSLVVRVAEVTLK
ncbi:MAG: alpha-L-fucosidase [Eubacteriales bacterium]